MIVVVGVVVDYTLLLFLLLDDDRLVDDGFLLPGKQEIEKTNDRMTVIAPNRKNEKDFLSLFLVADVAVVGVVASVGVGYIVSYMKLDHFLVTFQVSELF